MFIMIDPSLSRGKILPITPKIEWMPSSIHKPSDQFGNETLEVLQRLVAKTHDGKTIWTGWFYDRDDADAFLESMAKGLINQEKALWDLPKPSYPGLDLNISYYFATVTFLTGTSATDQTWTIASDWNSADNSVEVIASGGSGGARRGASSATLAGRGSGAGGGGYSITTNITLTPGGSATYRLSDGGVGVSPGVAVSSNGNLGANAWFNGTSLTVASVSARGGAAGRGGSGGSSTSGGSGGSTTSAIGTIKFAGGSGGTLTSTSATGNRASGGGGAGGTTATGGAGTASSAPSVATKGGAGGATNGGTGSVGATDANTSNGADGTAFQSSPNRGPGGASGGAVITGTSAFSSGSGGYGAGSGGGSSVNTGGATGAITTGNGGQALIVITYAPAGQPFVKRGSGVYGMSYTRPSFGGSVW